MSSKLILIYKNLSSDNLGKKRKLNETSASSQFTVVAEDGNEKANDFTHLTQQSAKHEHQQDDSVSVFQFGDDLQEILKLKRAFQKRESDADKQESSLEFYRATIKTQQTLIDKLENMFKNVQNKSEIMGDAVLNLVVELRSAEPTLKKHVAQFQNEILGSKSIIRTDRSYRVIAECSKVLIYGCWGENWREIRIHFHNEFKTAAKHHQSKVTSGVFDIAAFRDELVNLPHHQKLMQFYAKHGLNQDVFLRHMLYLVKRNELSHPLPTPPFARHEEFFKKLQTELEDLNQFQSVLTDDASILLKLLKTNLKNIIP